MSVVHTEASAPVHKDTSLSTKEASDQTPVLPLSTSVGNSASWVPPFQTEIHDSHLASTKEGTVIKEESINQSLPKNRIRDSTFPRHPLSAYTYFARNWRKINPTKVRPTSITSELREAWRTAPTEERVRCIDLAKRDNERFRREFDAFHAKKETTVDPTDTGTEHSIFLPAPILWGTKDQEVTNTSSVIASDDAKKETTGNPTAYEPILWDKPKDDPSLLTSTILATTTATAPPLGESQLSRSVQDRLQELFAHFWLVANNEDMFRNKGPLDPGKTIRAFYMQLNDVYAAFDNEMKNGTLTTLDNVVVSLGIVKHHVHAFVLPPHALKLERDLMAHIADWSSIGDIRKQTKCPTRLLCKAWMAMMQTTTALPLTNFTGTVTVVQPFD